MPNHCTLCSGEKERGFLRKQMGLGKERRMTKAQKLMLILFTKIFCFLAEGGSHEAQLTSS
jgi:hypothetical protein